MKPVTYCIILLFCILTSGCVKRTVSVSKVTPGQDGSEQNTGQKAHSKVLEEKTIWIWQDEYRNR
jgi:hypothetical protein